jgi:membrane protein implicated in regulation of membrane protease activity
LAWVLAIPLAFLLVGIPARLGGYLTSQKLLDVIIKRNITRFVPVFLIILAWALATAILVTLIVEILSILLDRRRLRRVEKRSSSSQPQALQTR